jgi:hypothetical protein
MTERIYFSLDGIASRVLRRFRFGMLKAGGYKSPFWKHSVKVASWRYFPGNITLRMRSKRLRKSKESSCRWATSTVKLSETFQMLGFLKSLFPVSTITVEDYWLETAIRLPQKVCTPSGGKVTIVNVCVNVTYYLHASEIIITNASLSCSRGFLAPREFNVSSQRTGEIWYTTSLPVSNTSFRDAARIDLANPTSGLRKIIFGKAGEGERRSTKRSNGTRFDLSLDLARAINSQAGIQDIQQILDNGSIHSHITFKYTKLNGESKKRRVVVHGTEGRSIAATDKSDGKRKHFRIERISDARVDT